MAAFPLSPSARLPIRGIQLAVQDVGEGPTIAFSHGLLWSKEMFAPQIANLATEYRCVAWDHRGQGESDVPEGRSVPIEDCYEDAVALIEGLDCGPVHFVGLSMGGFVGMRVAARRPDLVRSLVLIESAADPEPPANIPKYRRLNWVARWLGVPRFLARHILPILLGHDILNDPDRGPEREALIAQLMTRRRQIYKAVYDTEQAVSKAYGIKPILPPEVVFVSSDELLAKYPDATPKERENIVCKQHCNVFCLS